MARFKTTRATNVDNNNANTTDSDQDAKLPARTDSSPSKQAVQLPGPQQKSPPVASLPALARKRPPVFPSLKQKKQKDILPDDSKLPACPDSSIPRQAAQLTDPQQKSPPVASLPASARKRPPVYPSLKQKKPKNSLLASNASTASTKTTTAASTESKCAKTQPKWKWTKNRTWGPPPSIGNKTNITINATTEHLENAWEARIVAIEQGIRNIAQLLKNDVSGMIYDINCKLGEEHLTTIQAHYKKLKDAGVGFRWPMKFYDPKEHMELAERLRQIEGRIASLEQFLKCDMYCDLDAIIKEISGIRYDPKSAIAQAEENDNLVIPGLVELCQARGIRQGTFHTNEFGQRLDNKVFDVETNVSIPRADIRLINAQSPRVVSNQQLLRDAQYLIETNNVEESDNSAHSDKATVGAGPVYEDTAQGYARYILAQENMYYESSTSTSSETNNTTDSDELDDANDEDYFDDNSHSSRA